jgi:hypothetical protein
MVLRLFGKGAIWQAEAAAGLKQALASGIQLAPDVRSRAKLTVTSEHRRMQRLVLPGAPVDHIGIEFLSPVAFERRDAIAVDRDMLFGSILSRVAGLAAWHGMLLSGAWEALAEEAAGTRIDASGLKPVGWTRRSYRQHGRIVAMKGLIGRLHLHGQLDRWLPLLALLPAACLGSHTALGLGACRPQFETKGN